MSLLGGLDGNEIITEDTLATKVNQGNPSIVDIDEKWITFANLRCERPDGTPFEYYHRVKMHRGVWRSDSGKKKGEAVVLDRDEIPEYCNEHGMFLPTSALYCNALITMYEQGDTEVHDFVERMMMKGFSLSNTLVNWPQRFNHVVRYGNSTDQRDFATVRHFDRTNQEFLTERVALPVIEYAPSDYAYDFQKVGPELFKEPFMQLLTGVRDAAPLHQMARKYGGEYSRRFHAKLYVNMNYCGTRHVYIHGNCIIPNAGGQHEPAKDDYCFLPFSIARRG